MPKKDTHAENMPGHAARTEKGTLRRIRGDTQIGTLEKRYKVDLDVRKDMRWDTYKTKYDVDSVREALRKAKK